MTEILAILIALILVGLLGGLQMRFSIPSAKVQLFHLLWKSMGKRTMHCQERKTGKSTHSFTMKGLLTR
ncbi:MAG: hypothetical protein F9K32_17330 [Desulfobulbaceae bacterium]|nr:MAG: hypothetical protein F9K32_17330 [Desulfobulbaceae bacterium]